MADSVYTTGVIRGISKRWSVTFASLSIRCHPEYLSQVFFPEIPAYCNLKVAESEQEFRLGNFAPIIDPAKNGDFFF